MTATRAETLLKIEGVNLQFGSKIVLRDVNAEVRNLHRDDFFGVGQVIAFLGPSGIGKTQLLRILAGLQKPTSGTVRVGEGQDPVKPGMVGMVAQGYPLYNNRTVLSNLMVALLQNFPWTIQFDGKVKRKCKDQCLELLGKLGLVGIENFYPQQLSGGQRQRVAVAQQMLCSEHFILFDEPTTGLDPLAKKATCGLLVEIANQHDLNTIIIVTHDIPSALAVADTVWIMGREKDSEGKMIPGARIVEEINLIDQGLCWQPDIAELPKFQEMIRSVERKFDQL